MNRIWDVFARMGPWLFVLLAVGAWVTRHGGAAWHESLGYGVLLVASARIGMGFMRSKNARIAILEQSSPIPDSERRDFPAENPVDTPGLRTYSLMTVLLAAILTSVSGWLHGTDRFWGVKWIGAAHTVLAFALVAAAIALAVVTALGRRTTRS